MNNVYESDILIVGGGPAGISAAVALRKRGVERVTILEREQSAGGVPRHCGHPPFGMREFGRVYDGPSYAARLVRYADEHGVRILTGTTVTALLPEGRVQVVNSQGRATMTARRVLLATGVRETPRSARLTSGDRPVGVINTGALQAFVYQRNLIPFKRPLIVGTELVSISAVLTCRKAGIKPVAMVEQNARPTTRRPFALFPRMLGLPVWYGAEIEKINGTKRVESVLLRLANGSTREVACDGVLFTGRFTPEATLVRGSHLELDPGSGGPRIDQYGRCSDPAYFAAGNLLRPVETAGWSFREGRRIGDLLADDLEKKLPSPDTSIPLLHDEAIKLVVPQRLTLPLTGNGLTDLQLRVTRAFKGELVIRNGGEVIWQRAIDALPERRILVPLRELHVPFDIKTLHLTLTPTQ
jgi:NADPH-dependent 2,4-dienoyl-CoA reductase/sulfur reductase-like enzyme